MDWTSVPPLTALRAFAAYAEMGSVTKAGGALNVSHAAISQQIRLLEEHLGSALMDRSARKMALTADGQRLAAGLQLGFGTIVNAVEELRDADAGRPVQISVTPTFATNWLMPRLPDFRRHWPDIDLLIDPSTALAELLPGGTDIAIRYGAGNWAGLESEIVLESELVVLGAPSLVGDKEIHSAADLASFPWLQETGTTEYTDWLLSQGISKDRRGGLWQLPGNLLMPGVLQGQGVAVSVRHFVKEDIAAGRLRVLFEIKKESGYFLVTRPGVLRPAARAFATWVRRQARADQSPYDDQGSAAENMRSA